MSKKITCFIIIVILTSITLFPSFVFGEEKTVFNSHLTEADLYEAYMRMAKRL